MDSYVAVKIQHHACNLTCLLKQNHDFLPKSDFFSLMNLLYRLIDNVDDFIDL